MIELLLFGLMPMSTLTLIYTGTFSKELAKG